MGTGEGTGASCRFLVTFSQSSTRMVLRASGITILMAGLRTNSSSCFGGHVSRCSAAFEVIFERVTVQGMQGGAISSFTAFAFLQLSADLTRRLARAMNATERGPDEESASEITLLWLSSQSKTVRVHVCDATNIHVRANIANNCWAAHKTRKRTRTLSIPSISRPLFVPFGGGGGGATELRSSLPLADEPAKSEP